MGYIAIVSDNVMTPVSYYFGFCRQVRHGHGKTILSQAAFALQDYTLPTFSVKIDLPDVIRDSRDGQVPIHITVRSGATSTSV